MPRLSIKCDDRSVKSIRIRAEKGGIWIYVLVIPVEMITFCPGVKQGQWRNTHLAWKFSLGLHSGVTSIASTEADLIILPTVGTLCYPLHYHVYEHSVESPGVLNHNKLFFLWVTSVIFSLPSQCKLLTVCIFLLVLTLQKPRDKAGTCYQMNRLPSHTGTQSYFWLHPTCSSPYISFLTYFSESHFIIWLFKRHLKNLWQRTGTQSRLMAIKM